MFISLGFCAWLSLKDTLFTHLLHGQVLEIASGTGRNVEFYPPACLHITLSDRHVNECHGCLQFITIHVQEQRDAGGGASQGRKGWAL